jgi:hypothetical protein
MMPMRRRAALSFVFVAAAACAAIAVGFADAAPGGVAAPSDSVPTAAKPDSFPNAAPTDSVPAPAPPDTVRTAAPDTISTVPADTSAASATIKPKGTSILPDTLEFLPPGSQAGAQPKGAGAAPAAPKQRVGLLGIHPVAILFGLAALSYFVVKAATD